MQIIELACEDRSQIDNAALGTMPDNPPITQEETEALARQLLWFVDPSIIKIVQHGPRLMGFILAYPDIPTAVQKTQGKVFPFDRAELALELRKTRRVILNGAGIIPEEQGLGRTAILISEIARELLTSRSVHIRSKKERMLQEVRKFGVEFYKRHRLYRKAIGQGAG